MALDEGINLKESITIASTNSSLNGEKVEIADNFSGHSHFLGFQIGANAEYWYGNLFANVTPKLAIGGTRETVGIGGSTVLLSTSNRVLEAFPAGILALPSNTGRFHQDEFSVVPEIALRVGFRFEENVRFFLGYTCVYWSDVVRPGQQIDRVVNPSQVPVLSGGTNLVGTARPTVDIKNADWWAHGIHVGLEIAY
jgi:hypothetical protein